MSLTDDEVILLTCEILRQAVDDYRLLHRRGLTYKKEKSAGEYSTEEIEEFFNGEWAELMIHDGLRYRKLNGSDFLRAAVS